MKNNLHYLVIYSKKNKHYFTKYFETEHEKDKYRKKIYHIKDWILIEDSSDINYGNIEEVEFNEFKYDSQI